MQKNTFFRRAAALLLTAVLAVSAALPGLAVYEMPIQTANEGESVYLFNADIDKPILEQNIDQQRYIASLTKMMTALLFLESGKDLNAEITIPTSLTQEFKDIQNANGSTMNLRIGETVRRIDLLYGLLVASANDAASVIASDVADGSLPNFVAMMNQKAQELGCTSTSFTCVHGLYDYGNVSSAHDLALIASACAANETYMKAANTLSYTLPATNLHQNERTITSTNLMLNPEYPYYRDYIRGMKTGFTTLAGRCYVTFAQKGGHTYDHGPADQVPQRGSRGALCRRTPQRLRPRRRQGDLQLRAAGERLRHRQERRRPRRGHRLSGRLRGGQGQPRDPSGIRLRLSHRPQKHPASHGSSGAHSCGPQLRHHGRQRRFAEPEP